MGRILFFTILGFLIGLAYTIARRKKSFSETVMKAIKDSFPRLPASKDREEWVREFYKKTRHFK